MSFRAEHARPLSKATALSLSPACSSLPDKLSPRPRPRARPALPACLTAFAAALGRIGLFGPAGQPQIDKGSSGGDEWRKSTTDADEVHGCAGEDDDGATTDAGILR